MSGTGRIRINTPVAAGTKVRVQGQAYESLMLWEPRPGEAFTISGPGGGLMRARLAKLEKENALMEVFEDMGAVEPPVDILLIQALPEKERMELVIQKAAELGAASVLPFKSARSISLEQRDARQGKSHRWSTVALKASRQCRSPFITEVLPYRGFEAALEAGQDCSLRLALWEKPGIERLKDVLKKAYADGVSSAAILAGPEGGFTEDEMRRARGRGFTPVSLGERILRTETAALAAVALARYELCG